MKHSLFFLMIALFTFSACQSDQTKSVDINALQKSLDSDPEVAKLRALLDTQTRLIATISPSDLDNLFSKSHECGLNGSTASPSELEKCLGNMPSAAAYIESQEQLKAYNSQYEVVKSRFPDFALLDYKKQAELLVRVDEAAAEQVLNDFLSKTKK